MSHRFTVTTPAACVIALLSVVSNPADAADAAQGECDGRAATIVGDDRASSWSVLPVTI